MNFEKNLKFSRDSPRLEKAALAVLQMQIDQIPHNLIRKLCTN